MVLSDEQVAEENKTWEKREFEHEHKFFLYEVKASIFSIATELCRAVTSILTRDIGVHILRVSRVNSTGVDVVYRPKGRRDEARVIEIRDAFDNTPVLNATYLTVRYNDESLHIANIVVKQVVQELSENPDIMPINYTAIPLPPIVQQTEPKKAEEAKAQTSVQAY
jgi:hypothetical protein